MGRLRRGGEDFDFLFDMEPSESLEEEESIGEEDVSTVEGEEGGEEHMTSFVSLLENCFEGISEEGGRGRGEDPFEDEEESVGVVADDISNPSGEVYNNTAPSMPFSVKKNPSGWSHLCWIYG